MSGVLSLLLSNRGDATKVDGSWFRGGIKENKRRKSQRVWNRWLEVTGAVETKQLGHFSFPLSFLVSLSFLLSF